MVSWKHDLWKGWGLSQNHMPPVSLQNFLEGFVNVSPHHMDVLFQAIDLDPAERVMVKLDFGKIWIHRSHHFWGEFSAGNITSKMSIPRWRDKQFPTSQVTFRNWKTMWISEKLIHIKSWLSIGVSTIFRLCEACRLERGWTGGVRSSGGHQWVFPVGCSKELGDTSRLRKSTNTSVAYLGGLLIVSRCN